LFPDGESALKLAASQAATAGTAWFTKRYLNIELLKDVQMRGVISGLSQRRAPLSPNQMCEKLWTLPLRVRWAVQCLEKSYFRRLKSLQARPIPDS
jgi:hypothetical protein